jgi:hypothetical protein
VSDLPLSTTLLRGQTCDKKPGGPPLKVLNLIERMGLEAAI